MIVFGSGIALTVIMFLIFWAWIGGYKNMSMLLTIAVLSGIVGMLTFHKSLLKSGSEFKNVPKA
jgi:general stress protein CsbA